MLFKQLEVESTKRIIVVIRHELESQRQMKSRERDELILDMMF